MSDSSLGLCMLNGEARMLFDPGYRSVVLFARPRAAALPRETERTMGIQSQLPSRCGRHVRFDLVVQENSDVKGGPQAIAGHGSEPQIGTSPGVGRKS
jgi:hypothetical protein